MAECSSQAALASFVREVIDPLLVILESSDNDNDTSAAADLLEDSFWEQVLNQYKDGLDKLFKMYSHFDTAYGHRWSVQSLINFSRQFQLGPEFTPLVLQKVCSECARIRPTSVAANMKLNYQGYRVAIIILSQKVRASDGCSPHDKLKRFLQHVNMIAESTPGLGDNVIFMNGRRKLFDLTEFEGEDAF